MKKAFLFCGLTGWCMEVLWTGLHSVLSGELTMTGKTSLLMFPIYGCAAIIRPLSEKFSTFPSFVRGCIYSVGIFFVEFISGSFLRHFHMCPWNYSDAPLNYKGLIRLDYAPLWFGAGLLFEKIRCCQNKCQADLPVSVLIKKDHRRQMGRRPSCYHPSSEI